MPGLQIDNILADRHHIMFLSSTTQKIFKACYHLANGMSNTTVWWKDNCTGETLDVINLEDVGN